MKWTFRLIGDRTKDGMGYVSDEEDRDVLHVGERTLSEAENIAIGNLAAAAPCMQAALKAIAGGLINSDCLMTTPPDWHSAYSQLQAIARAALQETTGDAP